MSWKIPEKAPWETEEGDHPDAKGGDPQPKEGPEGDHPEEGHK